MRGTIRKLIFLPMLIVGCAVTQPLPALKINRLAEASSSGDGLAAVIGMYSTLEEGMFRNNVGVMVTSVDGVEVTPWQGAIFQAGSRTITFKYLSVAYKTNESRVVVNFKPGGRYLVRAMGDELGDRKFVFWVEDANTREVVFGKPHKKAADFEKSHANFSNFYAHYREFLNNSLLN